MDLTGYFSGGSGALFTPIAPGRFLSRMFNGGETYHLGVKYVDPSGNGSSAVPYGIQGAAIAANVTVTDTVAAGYITVYPDDETTAPSTSVVNYVPSQTVPNAVTVGLGSGVTGGIDVYNGSSGRADVIVDVFGYYANP